MEATRDSHSVVQIAADSDVARAAHELKRLVRAMAVGEVMALARFYELTVRQVFAVAHFTLRSREDAEEIGFDVYKYVWQNAVAYDATRGSVRAWLSVMTRNRAIDRLRRRRPAISLDDEDHEVLAAAVVGTALGPEQTLALVQSSAAVHRALQSLSEKRRSLVRLAFFEEKTHEEIAAALGMPLGTVKSHVRRALAAMQRHLAAEV